MTLKQKTKNALMTLLLTAYAVLLVVYSVEIANDVRSAVYRCINVIIPSLFAFMAVSQLIMKSGAYIYISKPFKPIAWLMKLPYELTFVFLMSNLAGYPIGASMLSELADSGSIDKKSASRLLCSCFNGGPAFFCSVVGAAVFGSVRTGIIVYLSIFAANFLLAAVLNRVFPIKYSGKEKKFCFRSEMLFDSVAEAGESLFKICGMILIFQTFLTLLRNMLLDNFFASQNIKALTFSFAEITNLSELQGQPFRFLPIVTAAGAFGGICIIMQIKSVVRNRFFWLPFICARIFCAVLAALICKNLNTYFGIKSISVAIEPDFIVNLNNFLPSLCLIMMIFLIVLKKRLAFSRKV